MRAMIVAAGLGTRLQPLTHWLPKPAVPIRGIPLIATSLALLASAGVKETVINLHHLPGLLADAARDWCPAGMMLHFSHEPDLLHTGGAIRRVADFLRESDPCVILGGDMILDLDLAGLVARHQASGRAATFQLLSDPRADRFGTIGLDDTGALRRVAGRFDLGGETQAGLYTWVNVVSPQAFESLPDRDAFNHLDDWLAPRAEAIGDVGGEIADSEADGDGQSHAPQVSWRPVGTMDEYLRANFTELHLSYMDVDHIATQRGVQLQADRVIGVHAEVPEDAELERVVVWDGEKVPKGFVAREGVFAGGTFHSLHTEERVGARP